MTTGIVSYCFFCGSAGRAGSSCPSCLVLIPRPSPEVTSPLACPRCTTPLLTIGIAPSASIRACQTCHGMFVGARAWCTLVARPELARAISAKLPARQSPASQLLAMLRCPVCPQQMERGRFGASSDIVIDVCVAHGMWLDSGEVVSIADHAALRARIGVHAARRATDAADARGMVDPSIGAREAEATLRAAAAPARAKKLGGAGVLVFVALLALRYFVFARGGAAAPPEIKAAGESAATAASALGNR